MLVLAGVLGALGWAPPARADRPTSGDMSLISGRTLGNGENALAAGIGWPGLWAGFWLAPSSSFNLAFKGSVVYGSPLIGFSSGVGGELSIPVRWHIFGKGQLDISVAITPAVTIGQGSVEGQEGTFSDNLGYAARGEAGLLAGAQVSRAVTLTLGAMGGLGWLNVPDATGASYLFVSTWAVAGIELLFSRDTMLLVEAHGGYGFTSSAIFASNAIGRIWIGIAYLM